MGHARRLAAFAAAVGLFTIWATGTASAGLTLNPTADALARAIVSNSALVTGADYVTRPPSGTPTAIGTDELAGFPTGGAGTEYGLLTTGNAALAPLANESGSDGMNDGGRNVRGDTDFDVTVLAIHIVVPAHTNCLVGMDFRFLSDEFPEWVGTAYNDAFIAELDKTTWTTDGSEIDARDNFAFDPSGNPITINAVELAKVTAGNAAGTTYDAATPLLTAATPISPGPHTLYLSIFDQGDQIYDSAVLIDNLRLGFVQDVPHDCKPGADLANGRNFVGLGDSYSSGYGMEPFFAGTHKDGTSNDCQRSEFAFAPLIGAAAKLNLDFHACQGAVTGDFYSAREGGTWGELRQLDYLNEDTGLVAFTIGGNDAHFADVIETCILGWELLPFNTCHDDSDVAPRVREAFDRLDGLTATPESTIPFDTLLKEVRKNTPYAARVQVGYPPLFTAEGSDRTWLPGGRCEGVKKADQRWMVETGAELNSIIARNAAANGFIFANPSPLFAGHELCSGGDEWFYGIASSGRFHPNQPGHFAMAESIIDALAAHDALNRILVGPNQTVIYRFTASGGLELLSVILEWPGSDIQLTLTSPSGKTYTRSVPGAGVYHANGPTWEQFQIPTPEGGEWTASLYGADVKPAGEQALIQVYQGKPRNQRPVGAIELRREGGSLVLDGSASRDPDGTIVSYDWYVSTATTDDVYQGKTVSIPATVDPQTVTLVVTDNGGLTDFVTTSSLPVDVKPGSDVNPINAGSTGMTPVALLTTDALDATTIDASTLRLGPKSAQATPPHVHQEDVNGDGKLDLMLQFPTQDIGVAAGMTTLCMRGELPDRGRTFQACDRIRVE
jgi:lysophospholipase L1-like esterase